MIDPTMKPAREWTILARCRRDPSRAACLQTDVLLYGAERSVRVLSPRERLRRAVVIRMTGHIEHRATKGRYRNRASAEPVTGILHAWV